MSEATIFDIAPSDIPPDGHTDAKPLRCEVEGCDNVVIKPARGRTPKRCPEHRAQSNQSNSGAPRLANWPNAATVHQSLVSYLNGLGFVVTLVNEADGTVIAGSSDSVATALVNLGRKDKAWRKWLERAAAPGKYGELTMVLLIQVALPILANHNALPQFRISGLTEAATQGEGV